MAPSQVSFAIGLLAGTVLIKEGVLLVAETDIGSGVGVDQVLML